MAISGIVARNSTISAASSIQTWQWDSCCKLHKFYIQNLTPGSNTASDTILYFDTVSSITTTSATAIQLFPGQYIEINFPKCINNLYFYGTERLKYQVFPI